MDDIPDRKTLHLLISGRVQGVGFRYWVRHLANAWGLSGWVRNAGDQVEAVISGPSPVIEAFIARCHRGPNLAQVTDIAVSPWDEPIQHGLFERRPSI